MLPEQPLQECGFPSRSRPESSEARRLRLPGRHRGKRGLFPPRCEAGKQQRSRAASSSANTARELFLTRKLAAQAVDGDRPESCGPGVARRRLPFCVRRGPFWPPGVLRPHVSLPPRGFPSRSRPESSEARRLRLPGRHRGKRGPIPPRRETGKQQHSRAASSSANAAREPSLA